MIYLYFTVKITVIFAANRVQPQNTFYIKGLGLPSLFILEASIETPKSSISSTCHFCTHFPLAQSLTIEYQYKLIKNNKKYGKDNRN